MRFSLLFARSIARSIAGTIAGTIVATIVATIVGAIVLAASPLLAQKASYTTFGAGCLGTGQGNQLPGVVLPQGHDQQFGNSNNYWGVSDANQRYQQVFLGSHIGTGAVFMSYQLRPDEAFPNRTGGLLTYTVLLGYTLQTPASIGGSFASNYDTPKGGPTTVFSGNVNLPAYNGTPTPQDWHFTVKFTRPWPYSYVQGENLLFEVVNTSAQGFSAVKDAVSGSGANTTRIVARNGATQATGNVYRDSGLVIKFNTPGGGGAIPALSASGVPSIGGSMQILLAQAKANSAALLALGASNTSWQSIPLPLDLTMLGAPSCALLVSPDVFVAVPTDAQGAANVPFGIPNDQALAGVVFHNQWFVVDAGANGLGLAFSNGGTGTIY